jgi:hypothetical protein
MKQNVIAGRSFNLSLQVHCYLAAAFAERVAHAYLKSSQFALLFAMARK